MNPLKERKTVTTKATTTLFIGSAVIAVVFLGMVSMPQLIVPAQAQSRGAENACKELQGLENIEKERGQCTADAKEETVATCPTVFGKTPTPTADNKCVATKESKTGAAANEAEKECTAAGGTAKTSGGSTKTTTCTYNAKITTIFTCPEGVQRVGEKCVSKPGDRTEEEV